MVSTPEADQESGDQAVAEITLKISNGSNQGTIPQVYNSAKRP
jgi:hypothetical protein